MSVTYGGVTKEQLIASEVFLPWYVITGRPCTGKSSVIAELEKRGHTVVNEGARELLDNHPEYLDRSQYSMHQMQTAIASYVVKIHLKTHEKTVLQPGGSKTVFCDSTAIDTIAYLNSNGDTPGAGDLELAQRLTYKGSVFMMEPLDVWEDDGQRIEEVLGRDVHSYIPAAYLQQGYAIISVPSVSISERADIIEDYVDKDQ